MSELKVDIRPIENLFIENLLENANVLGKEGIAHIFQGTDLKYNVETGKLETLMSGQLHIRTLQTEADFVRQLKAADRNGDKQLDGTEIRSLAGKGVDLSDPANGDAEDLIEKIDHLVKKRYAVLTKNIEKLQGELHWAALLESLETYNSGLKEDELRHANSTLPLNGLTKSLVNAAVLIPYNVFYRAFAYFTRMKNKPDNNLFYGDTLVARRANKNYQERKVAIAELDDAITAGFMNGEAWALSANLPEALKKLKPSSRSLLEDYLAIGKIHDVLQIKDHAKRFEALKKMALDERPTFLGYGGGNIAGFKTNDIFNYTGRHNNLKFSRSVLSYLWGSVQNPEKRSEITKIRRDMLGEGGGFRNLLAVGVSNLFCGPTQDFKPCRPTPYRRWSDEEEMDGVGRALNIGLSLFGSGKLVKVMSVIPIRKTWQKLLLNTLYRITPPMIADDVMSSKYRPNIYAFDGLNLDTPSLLTPPNSKLGSDPKIQ